MMVPFCCWWRLPGLIFVYFGLFQSAKFQFGLHCCQLLVNFQSLLRCLYFQSWSKLASYSACMCANTKNAKSLRYTYTSWRHEVLCKKYKLYCCSIVYSNTIKSVVQNRAWSNSFSIVGPSYFYCFNYSEVLNKPVGRISTKDYS